MRRERDGRRGVAALGLQQDGGGRQPHLAQLLGDEEAVGFVANDDGPQDAGNPASRAAVSWSMVRSPVSARSCLGMQLARQRPEARAGAAGEDHGDEGHEGGIVPVLIEWVINTLFQCYYSAP